MIDLLVQSFLYHLMCNETCLREDIYPSLNIHIHIPVPSVLILNIVVLNHNLGEVGEFEAHVLALIHWSVQIKIFYINCHEFCIEC